MPSLAQTKANKKWVQNNLEKQYSLNRKTASKSYYYKIGCDINIQFKLLRNMDIF